MSQPDPQRRRYTRIIWLLTAVLVIGILAFVIWREQARYKQFGERLNVGDGGDLRAYVADVRLGWTDLKGLVIDQNYASSSPAITLYIRNLDPWLIENAKTEPRMLPAGLQNESLDLYLQLKHRRQQPSNVSSAREDGIIDQPEAAVKPTPQEQGQLAAVNRWLTQERLNLRLMIAGFSFTSMKPIDVSPPGSVNDKTQDTITRAVFLLGAPEDSSDLQRWRELIRAVGANCSGEVTVVRPLPGGQVLLRMPTQVNADSADPSGAGAVRRELPIVPGIRRGAAAVAVVLSIGMVLAAAFGTRALRDGRDFTLAEANVKAPWSLARVTFAWWLAICVSSFAYIWAVTGEHRGTLSTTALLVLGISGATLFVTAGFGRRPDPSPESLPAAIHVAPQASRGFFADLLSEGGEAEVSRLQMLVWNSVLGVVFLWQTVYQWQMPEFDATIMTLLGISSTTYAGFKFLPGSGAPRPTEPPTDSSSSGTSSSSSSGT